MSKTCHIFIFFFLFSFQAFSKYDSLAMDKLIANYFVADSNVNMFVSMSDSIESISKEEGEKFILQVISKAQKSGNKFIEAYGLNKLGLRYLGYGLYSDAFKTISRAQLIFKYLDNQSGIFNTTSNIALVYSYMGEYKKALIYHFKALSVLKNKSKISGIYTKSTNIYINIGSMYGALNNTALARNYFYRSLDYYYKDPEKDSITRAFIYNNISDTYFAEGDLTKAEYFLDIAFDIKLKYGDNENKANAYMHSGAMFEARRNYNEAKNAYLKALIYCDTLMPTATLKRCYQALALVYAKLKNFEPENKYLKLKYKTQKYLDSIGMASEINNIEIKNTFRQQSINDSIQNIAQLKIRDVKLAQSKRESIYGTIVLIIMSFLAFLFFKRFRLSQKQKLLIEFQKKIVDEKNREITDSINYAKNLQDALIPETSELSDLCKDAFVLYFPKDIVAGDFYWWHNFPNTHKTVIAVADCTGHGVPGAMLSVVCINTLNRAVNEFNLSEPNLILDKVNELVSETFGKNNKKVNDGMDISLLLIDGLKKEVRWSGANNKLIYFKNDEMFIVKPNKQAIGKSEAPTPFTILALPFEPGAVFYLLTDGFSDQFGGNKNKKMGFSNFKNLLEKNHAKPMSEQKLLFEEVFNDWKNKSEQTDDVSLIGIRI